MYHDVPELLVTIDTDSWIGAEFSVNAPLDRMLDDFREANSETDEGTIMEAFPRYVYDRRMIDWASETLYGVETDMLEPKEPAGYYGEGEPLHIFTPNGETFLSIDVQFVMWGDEYGMHAVLRKADAYNGYGCATAYDVLGYDGTEPLDYASAIIACDGGTDPHPGQSTLDGTQWEPCRAVWDHVPGHNGVDQGHGFGTLPGYREEGDYSAEIGTEGKRGTLVIDHDERHAFCPVCGSGKLVAFKY